MPLELFNTLTRKREPFRPGDPARITFYSCGPTVYDDAHIGNFRSFLAADVLRRWLESPLCEVLGPDGSVHKGPREVRHVMNITDVGHMTEDDSADGGGEDKMALAGRRIAEAKKAGKLPPGAEIDPSDPRAIADFYAGRFLEDARALGLKVALEAGTSEAKRREIMPKATESIPGMVAMIEDLARKGCAYRSGDAVYFDVQRYARYGELSGNTLEKLRAGAGGRVSERDQAGKRHPADFLLWKADAKHIMRWPGPVIDGVSVGEGYPGWHIECSVMARAALGDVIDLHSGGEDNIFPHHECERAQSCCATGHDQFARHWLHARFLQVEGEKMSKSKGNFFTARDLFAMGHEPAAVRLELIKTHYRSNANFTMQGLQDASSILRRIRNFVRELMYAISGPESGRPESFDIDSYIVSISSAMQSDLNVAEVLGQVSSISSFFRHIPQPGLPGTNALFASWRESARKTRIPIHPISSEQAYNEYISSTGHHRSLAALHLIDGVLGVVFTPQANDELADEFSTDIGVFLSGITPSAEVESLLARRAEARKAKDFATSDRIRGELAAMGYAIKDVAGGKVEVSRK